MGNDVGSWQWVITWSLIIAVVCMDVSKTSLFSRLREWIKARSEFFGELVECPYCLSHWMSAAVCLAYQVNVMYVFVLVAAASVVMLLICLLLKLL